MASSGKKPGIKDISDLKARLGLTKGKGDEGKPDASAPEASAAIPEPSAPAQVPAGLPAGVPAGAIPAGIPAGVPSGAPMAKPAAPAPTGMPAGFGAPTPFGQPAPVAPTPVAAPAPAPAPQAAPVYAEEDDSYDYEPPPVPDGPDFDPNQFDPKIKQPRSMMKTAVFGAVAATFVIAALFVGMQIAEVGHDRDSVNRRINLAKDLNGKVQPKLDAFVAFIKPFKDRVDSGGRMESVTGYDQALFEQLGRYGSVDFMLDPSTDVPAEAIILAQNQKANPLPELRQYSSGTMILVQLISNHVSETNADKKEIAELLEATGSVEDETSELFALKFDPERYLEFIKEPLRVDGQFNFGVRAKGLWRVKKIVQSPEELAAIWKDMKGDYAAPAEEDDKTKGKKPKEKTEELDLPPKVIYQLQPRQGEPFYALADEIILITRSEIFGATPNALQRYEKRMTQILKAIVETEKSVEPLGSKLKTQANEELL